MSLTDGDISQRVELKEYNVQMFLNFMWTSLLEATQPIICSPVCLSVERECGRLAGGADGGGPGAALGAARPDLARYVVQGSELVATRAAAARRIQDSLGKRASLTLLVHSKPLINKRKSALQATFHLITDQKML